MSLLLLLLLPLLWGIECVGGRGPRRGPRIWMTDTSCRSLAGDLLGFWFRKEANNVNNHRDALVVTNDLRSEVKEETKGRFHLLGDPRNGSCSLLIRDAQKEDTDVYFFLMERRYTLNHKFVKDTLSLEVTGLTKKPDVYVPETLEPGRLGCPAPTFSWTGTAISPQGAGQPASYFSVLTLTLRPQDHNTELTCRVAFLINGMSTVRTIRLSVCCDWDNCPLSTAMTVVLAVLDPPWDITLSVLRCCL
ncbi:sialic acid-binding Ig-like lectin 16 [Trichechus inunguis]